MLKLPSGWSHKEELLFLLGKNHEKETIMNNESKLRECQNCGGLESSHPIIPTKVGGKYCNHFIQSTTPIEDGKGNEEIAINISEEWNTDADLRLLIKNALDAKDSTHALEKEAVHKKHSVIEARLFAEKKVLEATITSLEDDRTDQELKISALTEKKEGLEREVAEKVANSVGKVEYVCPYCGYPYN